MKLIFAILVFLSSALADKNRPIAKMTIYRALGSGIEDIVIYKEHVERGFRDEKRKDKFKISSAKVDSLYVLAKEIRLDTLKSRYGCESVNCVSDADLEEISFEYKDLKVACSVDLARREELGHFAMIPPAFSIFKEAILNIATKRKTNF